MTLERIESLLADLHKNPEALLSKEAQIECLNALKDAWFESVNADGDIERLNEEAAIWRKLETTIKESPLIGVDCIGYSLRSNEFIVSMVKKQCDGETEYVIRESYASTLVQAVNVALEKVKEARNG